MPLYAGSAMTTPQDSPLGKPATYKSEYDASLLFPIAREGKRAELDIAGTLPFFGIDIWNAYEVSWLNLRGKPQIAILSFMIPADSPNIVESKSFKLYLNSFNQTRLAGLEALQELLRADLSAAIGSPVQVSAIMPEDFGRLQMGKMDGLLLDRLDIEVENYSPDSALLTSAQHEAPVEETLVSHLLKSNCLVTGQPDWGSVQIHYVGPEINQEGLLKYLIGYRNHNEFHEQCVERIFMDLLRHCRPQKLAVYARFTRRGGLDINPWRSNFTTGQRPSNARLPRQ
jgi:7-cyano-7-deazaguanine reductase